MPSKTGSKLAALCVLASLFSEAAAQAQTTDAQLAQSLFERGRMLLASEQYAEACQVLAESQRLDPGGGTLLNLAVCHEKLGQTATAWTEFNAALSGALRDGRKDREDLARQHIAEIEPKLSHVTVVVPPAASGDLRVMIDGVLLGPAAWGVPAAMDPGMHRVVAVAYGREVLDQVVVVRPERDDETVRVPVPPPLVIPPRPTPVCAEGRTWNGTTCAPPKSLGKSNWRYVAGGGAVAATVLTVVSGVVALEYKSTMNADCNVSRQFCMSQSGVDAGRSVDTWAWVSTVSLVVALASGTAFVLWPSRKAVAVTPNATPTGAGLSLTGSF
jgi:hypothetical protein